MVTILFICNHQRLCCTGQTQFLQRSIQRLQYLLLWPLETSLQRKDLVFGRRRTIAIKVHATKPGNEINNGNATTSRDDSEGSANGWRRPWRISARPQNCNFWRGRDSSTGAAWQWDLRWQQQRWCPPTVATETAVEDLPAHDDNKKFMALPAMAYNKYDNLVDRCDRATRQWEPWRRQRRWHPLAAAATTTAEDSSASVDSPAHNDYKKCMASPATLWNKDNNLVDRGNDEGNSGGIENSDVLVGAQQQRWAHGVTWRRRGRHLPWRAIVRPYDIRQKPDNIGPVRKPVRKGSERSGRGFKFEIWNPCRRIAAGAHK